MLLTDLGVTVPVLAAPMAGGPTTPAMVVAADGAGSLGFLAGGYKTAETLAQQIATVRAATACFGVNLFVPNPVPVSLADYRSYAGALQAEAATYGLDLAGSTPLEDDDQWGAKIDLLLAEPVPVASFTFGVPDDGVVRRLRRAGTLVVQTVTSPEEARQAAEHGVDALAVQAPAAGGHYGTLTPAAAPAAWDLPALVAAVGAAVRLPMLAAGGIGSPAAAEAALAAGAEAVLVGTALLRTDESGASDAYRLALAAGTSSETVVTRAFTGRPARSLRNRFTERYDAIAPAGYPAVHHLTSPLRRAAAAAGDAGVLNLWAGTGHAYVPTGPAAGVLGELSRSG